MWLLCVPYVLQKMILNRSVLKLCILLMLLGNYHKTHIEKYSITEQLSVGSDSLKDYLGVDMLTLLGFKS